MSEVGKIYERLCNIQEDIRAVDKKQKNTTQNFNFRGITDIYNELHQHFARHRVFSIPLDINTDITEREVTTNGKVQVVRLAVSKVKYRFYTDDGSFIDMAAIGEAIDYGDKAIGKTLSYAHKTAIIQMFTVTTVDQKDADSEGYVLTKTHIEKRQIDNIYAIAKFKGISEEAVNAQVIKTCGVPIEYITQEQFANLTKAISSIPSKSEAKPIEQIDI